MVKLTRNTAPHDARRWFYSLDRLPAPRRRRRHPEPRLSTLGLCKAWYRGTKKVELEHYLGATAINITRLDADFTHSRWTAITAVS